jgi:hypothetical protein
LNTKLRIPVTQLTKILMHKSEKKYDLADLSAGGVTVLNWIISEDCESAEWIDLAQVRKPTKLGLSKKA